ncbi:MAG: response regulator transcription factor [Gammaproteobacteria bacterium]|jgi:two-component system, OmpR family, response regulator
MHQILLIDDDERLAELLQQYFMQHNLTLHSATRPSEGLAKLETNNFDLVILDIMLPEMDGFEVCRTIRKQNEIPILMLTARGEVMDRVVGLELGADDYLSKPFEPRELVARIQNILKRSGNIPSQKKILTFEDLTVDTGMRQVQVSGAEVPLSTMEYQLLELFAKTPGKTFTRDEILNHLKGIDTEILSRSVDILVSRLRQKIKPLELIKTVRGSGYIFVGNSK